MSLVRLMLENEVKLSFKPSARGEWEKSATAAPLPSWGNVIYYGFTSHSGYSGLVAFSLFI